MNPIAIFLAEPVEEILHLIRCPEKRVPLRPATAAELARLNARIAAGEMQDVGGETVEDALAEALVRDGDDLAYPVREGIPILLIERGLPLPPSPPQDDV